MTRRLSVALIGAVAGACAAGTGQTVAVDGRGIPADLAGVLADVGITGNAITTVEAQEGGCGPAGGGDGTWVVSVRFDIDPDLAMSRLDGLGATASLVDGGTITATVDTGTRPVDIEINPDGLNDIAYAVYPADQDLGPLEDRSCD